MPPQRRALKATPSNAGDLSGFQHQLLRDIKSLHDDLHGKRQPFPFWEVAQTYAKTTLQDRRCDWKWVGWLITPQRDTGQATIAMPDTVQQWRARTTIVSWTS